MKLNLLSIFLNGKFHNEKYRILIALCNYLSPFATTVANHEQTDWSEIIALANRHYLTPALYGALASKGLLETLEPQLKGYLEAIYQLNAERNRILLEQIHEVVDACNQIGIEPILLKGAAALAEELYFHPGARFMVDLDIWVPPEKLEDAIKALEVIGYRVPEKYAGEEMFNFVHHAAPMIKSGGVASVELHRRISDDTVANAALLEQSQCVAITLSGGGRARVLSPTGQVLHGIIHSEIHHGYYRLHYVAPRQLHHFITLCHRHGAEIDREKIHDFMMRHGYQHVLNAYLHLAWELCAGPFAVSPGLTERRHFWNSVRHKSQLRRVFVFFWMLENSFSSATLRRRYSIPDDQSPWPARLQHMIYLLRRYRNPENRSELNKTLMRFDG